MDPTKTISELSAAYKGHAQHTAPMLDFKQEEDIRITLTNLGLVQRPDLTDSHTIHWHGFDIPTPLNDGVPEVSVAVPIGKQFTYFYRPHRRGHLHVPLSLRGRRTRADGHDRHRVRTADPGRDREDVRRQDVHHVCLQRR